MRLPEGNLVNAERDDLSAEENLMPAGEILMVSGKKKQPVFGFQTGCFQVPNRLFSGRKQPPVFSRFANGIHNHLYMDGKKHSCVFLVSMFLHSLS